MKSSKGAPYLGASTICVAASGVLLCGFSLAQTPSPPAGASDLLQEVVVTGTNIRGAAAVGSDVMVVDRAAIEDTGAQTLQQILRGVPAIASAGATPQGLNPGNTFFSPTVHGLGGSSSNSTLVLIDGHRVAPGNQGSLVDPNVIPPIAIERVEVLAEGASSIYGSDAVAGVVNFITRRDYEGFEVTGQTGFGDSYRTYAGGALWGTKWDTGSVMVAYGYSKRSALEFADRDYLNRDHRAQGGTNFGTFFCGPASVQPGGAGNIYLGPGYTTSLANTAANSPCQLNAEGEVIPKDQRNTVFARLHQKINDKLSIGVDLSLARLETTQATSRGTLTATVFRTGAQANPFYVNPTGIVGGTTAGDRQTVRFNGDELLGDGAFNTLDTKDYFVSTDLEYKPGDNFRITALALLGQNSSFIGTADQLCVSCANLALNGTTNSSGSLTAPSIPGTTTIVTGLPLTAANALDVWNPAATNRTSSAVLAQLTDSGSLITGRFSLRQFKLGTDGTLATLPGGDLRLAIGAEYAYYDFNYNRRRSNNTGPASTPTGSEFFNLYLDRHVESGFAELLVPLVGPGNAKSFTKRLDVSISGRYDRYSEVGSTSNPRIALGWQPVEGLKVRSSYSRSFVAPQLVVVGDLTRGGLTTLSNASASNVSIIVPRDNFPNAVGIPGVSCTTTTCTVSSTVNGISVNGGALNAQPGKGESWTIGVDLAPSFMPGFTANITLFNNKLINQITGSNLGNIVNSAALNGNLVFYPGGATQAQINSAIGGYPLQTTIPSPIYYTVSVRSQNILNLDIQGIDASLNWKSPGTSVGTFNVGGSVTYFTRFDQFIKGGAKFSVLNTTGFNTAFPSIQTQARGNLGWEIGAFSTNVFVNYVGSYRNYTSTTVVPVVTANGVPVSGGDKVKANTTIDLNLSYTLHSGRFEGSQLFVDVNNVFDKDPVFYNVLNGVDQFSGNILGRVITAGFRAKF
jgi:iron complex outermembrane receptor protein